MDSDLARLRAAHPDWQITTVWATACSGPDARRLMAYRYADHRRVLLTAWTEAELRQKIRDEEQA
jgi:hypothetical protein